VFATTSNWPKVLGEELEGTRTFVSTTVDDPRRRQVYLAVLDALSGGVSWDSVLASEEFGATA
jgi:hypothetical protein